MKNIAYAFFGLLFVVKLQASNYYFSFSTGNDSNPINSQTTPWKTITKLNTLSLLRQVQRHILEFIKHKHIHINWIQLLIFT